MNDCLQSLYLISCVAVNCFVMISGYFLIDKLNLRWKGMLKIWIQAFFYCSIFLIITLLTGENVGLKDVIKELFPVYGARYWFLTTYMGLMLVAPFLSRLAVSLEKRQYGIMLLLLFVICFAFLYGKIYAGIDTILWFSFLYLVAGYIKLFGVLDWMVRHKGKILLVCWGVLVVFALGVSIIHRGGYLMSTNYDGPVFFLSLAVFNFFANTSFKGRFVEWQGVCQCGRNKALGKFG